MPPNTTIITLESHDSLPSVRDRLSWARTARILLRWPAYEDVKLSFLDLKVLQRHARGLGAQLGLVTRRRQVRRDATALGIPVFESPAGAQRARWPGPVRRRLRTWRPPRKDLRALRQAVRREAPAWQTKVGVRAAAFALGVAAVLVVCAAVLPTAEISIYPSEGTRESAPPTAIYELVRGRTAGQAASRLDGYLRPRLPSSVLIDPSWWPWVPLGPFGVAITVR